MPKLQMLASRTALATQIELTDLLAQFMAENKLTKTQFAALHKTIRPYLPAFVQFEQRTPKSVITVRIEKDARIFTLKINNRAKVSLSC